MTKHEFTEQLSALLIERGLDKAEAARSADFYSEMIDDRMEDGMTEEDAVAALGELDTIATEILYDKPLGTLVRSSLQKKKEHLRTKPILIVLAILGFPIWFSLGVAAVAVIFSLFAAVFSAVIALFVADAAIAITGIAIVPAALFSYVGLPAGFAVGVAFLLIGTAILLFFPVKWAAKGLIRLAALMFRGVKSLFISKSKA